MALQGRESGAALGRTCSVTRMLHSPIPLRQRECSPAIRERSTLGIHRNELRLSPETQAATGTACRTNGSGSSEVLHLLTRSGRLAFVIRDNRDAKSNYWGRPEQHALRQSLLTYRLVNVAVKKRQQRLL